MLRVYKEHPQFDEFSKFDTENGRLVTITGEEFDEFMPEDIQIDDTQPIQKIKGKNAAIFLGETPETHTRFPRRVYFQITRNCNLECPACFIKAEKGGNHVPTPAVMDIAKFMGQNGLMEVRLTGGEPTTHPDFFHIMHRFQEENVYISVATNGMFNQKTLDALCEEKNLWIICSIDGNRETHNSYRPGTFDKIIGNLKHLKEKNPLTRIRITTILTRKNQNQMYELGKICKSVAAESITIIPLRPQVRDPRIKNDMITAIEFKQAIEGMVEAKDKLGIEFTTTIETDYKSKIYSDPIFRKKSSCAAGREGTNLDYDSVKNKFLIYGCAYSPASDLNASPIIKNPFLAGTFSPDSPSSFLDIWRDNDAWTIFRNSDFKPAECKSCEYFIKHQCVGSCPIQNIDYSCLNVNESILDQLKNQIIHTGEWYCYKKII